MRSLPTPPTVPPPVGARQLSIPFDSTKLRGISTSDRRMALDRLTCLLLEAAGVASEEHDDDER